MTFPNSYLKDLSLCLGDQRVAKILYDAVNDVGVDGSWAGTSVTATGAIQGATVEGTTSITTPSLTVTAGGAGSLSSIAAGALATFSLVSGSYSSGMTVSGSLSQAAILGTSGAASLYLGGVEAAASSYTQRVYTKADFPDNVATAIITVTVPNAKHGGMLFLKIVATNGSGECVNVGTGSVAICRSATDVATIVTAATIALTATAQDATVGADTNTLAYAVSAVSGLATAPQTFSITLQLNDSGSSATNKAIVVAELINFEGTGITMAAAA